MLGKCPKMANSSSDSSIRHQVRKLRAKVKALLPHNECKHFEKRNERVQDIEVRRRQWEERSIKTFWATGKIQKSEWFLENRNPADQKNPRHHLFEELSHRQIQAINEDKIYFLGEPNVPAYDNFLEEKGLNTMHFNNSSLFRSASSHNVKSKKNFLTDPPPRLKKALNGLLNEENPLSYSSDIFRKNNKKHFNRTSATSLQLNMRKRQGQNTGRFTLYSEKKIKTNENLKSQKGYKQRIEELEDKLKEKLMYDKIHLQIKQQKAGNIHRENQYRLFSKIKANKIREQNNLTSALKKRSILQKKGEISKMNEELRMIFIKKKKGEQNNESQIKIKNNKSNLSDFHNSSRIISHKK